MPDVVRPNPPTDTQTYKDVASKSLNLKVCLADRQPAGKELIFIREFLTEKIEEAVSERGFIPIFRNNVIGKDGVYLSCSDWLRNITKLVLPKVDAKIMVIPQDQTVNYNVAPNLVRTVLCLPSKKPNDFILNALAQLNPNIITEKWRIASRRFKGAVKTLLFMRMDRDSFAIIKNQNFKINWILGIQLTWHQNIKKAKTEMAIPPKPSSFSIFTCLESINWCYHGTWRSHNQSFDPRIPLPG